MSGRVTVRSNGVTRVGSSGEQTVIVRMGAQGVAGPPGLGPPPNASETVGSLAVSAYTFANVVDELMCTGSGNVVAVLQNDVSPRTYAIVAGTPLPGKFASIRPTGEGTTATGLYGRRYVAT